MPVSPEVKAQVEAITADKIAKLAAEAEALKTSITALNDGAKKKLDKAQTKEAKDLIKTDLSAKAKAKRDASKKRADKIRGAAKKAIDAAKGIVAPKKSAGPKPAHV